MQTIHALCLATCLSYALSQGALFEDNSFVPPLTNFDNNGNRVIPSWITGGSAEVNNNYVRLTNDRASKQGWIYNTVQTSSKAWTLEVQFRISGQGERLYGDGIAIWVTETTRDGYQTGGDLFGAPKKFKGFGILFDTYRNTELGNRHKDIMLISGDGTEEKEMHQVLDTGCDADYRLWEARDDFDAKDHSVVVIDFNGLGNKLKVRIDEKADGNLRDCFEFTFPANGLGSMGDMSKHHIGLSSSTGQLADNHDVLAVKLKRYQDQTAGLKAPVVEPENLSGGVPNNIKAYVQAHVKTLEARITDLEHQLEHKMDGVGDGLEGALKKLKEAEGEDRTRIEAIELRIMNKVAVKTEALVHATIKDTVAGEIDNKLEDTKKEIKMEIADEHSELAEQTLQVVMESMEEVSEQVKNQGRGWLLPFLVLSIALCAVSYTAYTKWRQLMKSHLP